LLPFTTTALVIKTMEVVEEPTETKPEEIAAPAVKETFEETL